MVTVKLYATAYSSHGTVRFDRASGKVISITRDCPAGQCDGCLPDIVQFDVNEWEDFYPDQIIPDNIDILDIGYWYTFGKQCRAYESPDREDI